jgi:hypothetical protein
MAVVLAEDAEEDKEEHGDGKGQDSNCGVPAHKKISVDCLLWTKLLSGKISL